MPVTPRPPPKGSPRSSGSARSSRESLEHSQAKTKLCFLIELRAQLDAKAVGHGFGPKARSRLHGAAKAQAADLLNHVDGRLVDTEMPAKVTAAVFRPDVMDPYLLNMITEAAAACSTLMSAPPTPMPDWSEPPPTTKLEQVQEHTVANPFVRKRLPEINVAGKPVPLEKLIQDKVMARGAGGAHQLRKMFQAFDLDGSGTVSVEEMDRFLRSNNIKINASTLSTFFDTWAGDKTDAFHKIENKDDDDDSTLNYMEFIEKILPADYPERDKKSQYAEDLASLARNDKQVSLSAHVWWYTCP